MKSENNKKFFPELLNTLDFHDRFLSCESGVDVIIPVLNTDIFLKHNLLSIYKEVPVNRLLVGDGGCTDNTLSVLAPFPRVVIFDHKRFNCQGASIKALIEEVETDNFIYCHADVFLPAGFFEKFSCLDLKNKWVETSRNHLHISETFSHDYYVNRRSYSGVQLGDSALLKKSVSVLEDDYVQRNEDIIIRELVESNGGIYEKLLHLVHLHQSPFLRGFGIPAYEDRDWAARIWKIQLYGIIKYLPYPEGDKKRYLLSEVRTSIEELTRLGIFNRAEFESWVRETNPSWLPVFSRYQWLWTLSFYLREAARRLRMSARILATGR